jgi:hypothetical protein
MLIAQACRRVSRGTDQRRSPIERKTMPVWRSVFPHRSRRRARRTRCFYIPGQYCDREIARSQVQCIAELEFYQAARRISVPARCRFSAARWLA